jgi:deazaflavin-dependent oxidoreductase (nitroreductase family)
VASIPKPFYFGTFNTVVKSLLRIGVPMGPMTLLTVKGRKSGIPRTTPIGLMQRDGRYYLVGTFGDANWCRNLRAAGEAMVGRGMKRRKIFAAEVLDPGERAVLLKEILTPYLKTRMGSQMLKMGYDLGKDSTMDDYAREAMRHPGFEIKFGSS